MGSLVPSELPSCGYPALLKYNSPSGPAQIRISQEHHGIAGDLGAELAMLPPWQVCIHCLSMGCPQCLAPAPDSCTTGHPQLVKAGLGSWWVRAESQGLWRVPWGILSEDADKHGWVGCGSFHLGFHSQQKDEYLLRPF